MFRSYEPGQADKVVLIMNVIPGEEPSSGPNYFNFDPTVHYSFHVDNDKDGQADDVGSSSSSGTRRSRRHDALGLPLSYVAAPADHRARRPRLRRARPAADVHGDDGPRQGQEATVSPTT